MVFNRFQQWFEWLWRLKTSFFNGCPLPYTRLGFRCRYIFYSVSLPFPSYWVQRTTERYPLCFQFYCWNFFYIQSCCPKFFSLSYVCFHMWISAICYCVCHTHYCHYLLNFDLSHWNLTFWIRIIIFTSRIVNKIIIARFIHYNWSKLFL